jgi:hypothetical protein
LEFVNQCAQLLCGDNLQLLGHVQDFRQPPWAFRHVVALAGASAAQFEDARLIMHRLVNLNSVAIETLRKRGKQLLSKPAVIAG